MEVVKLSELFVSAGLVNSGPLSVGTKYVGFMETSVDVFSYNCRPRSIEALEPATLQSQDQQSVRVLDLRFRDHWFEPH